MQVTAEQIDPCTLMLDIAVDEQQVARAFDASYREAGRHANVPGFRPGKAPRAVVERYVDKGRVRERALEKIISESYFKAIEEQGVTPYRNPDIEPTDLEDKKPYVFKAKVPLEPQVTLGAYTGITVEKPLFPVTDEMVEERITRLREDRARLERVEDRGVQAGDILIAENQIVIEGEETSTPARRQLVQMGNNIPGFDEAVLGMAAGEERTFELTYPEDFEEEPKRGKNATFTLKVSSISAKKLPELNDEFAVTVAGVTTMEELRSAVRERVTAEATRLSDQVAEQRILEEILKTSEVHFPEILVREEVQDRLKQLERELRDNKLGYAQYLERIGNTQDEHIQGLTTQAESQIRILLALRQIAILEGLQATDEAINEEFARLIAEGRITEEEYGQFAADSQRRLQVANALIQQKLHDFLFANNTLNEVEQTTPPSTEDLAEANEE